MSAAPRRTGLLPPEELHAMSGLDFLRGCIEGSVPYPPVAGQLGMELLDAEEGAVRWRVSPPDWFLNPAGVVHGGFAMTVLDTAMACAVDSARPAGRASTTLEAKINLTRAIRPGAGPLAAEGRLVTIGQRTGTAEGRLLDAGGRTLAFATTTCLIFDP
jgi:uncharacterized protein (TIGR00369 family)